MGEGRLSDIGDAPPPAVAATRTTTPRQWAIAAALGAAVLTGALFLLVPTSVRSADQVPAGTGAESFASELTGEVHEPLPAPETYTHGANIGGCDNNYGLGRECVPVNFPPGVQPASGAKCAWLREQGFGPLEVSGVDAQGLVPAGGPRAPSGNSYACPKDLGTR